MLTVVSGEGSGHEGGTDGSPSLIDEIVREGARRMLAEALRAEVDAYLAAFAAERGEDGRRLVVRNGSHQPREVLTSAGAIEVRAPRVNDKRTDPGTGERQRFSSAKRCARTDIARHLQWGHYRRSEDGQLEGAALGFLCIVLVGRRRGWRNRVTR
jgi:Transposase, Mutator family